MSNSDVGIQTLLLRGMAPLMSFKGWLSLLLQATAYFKDQFLLRCTRSQSIIRDPNPPPCALWLKIAALCGKPLKPLSCHQMRIEQRRLDHLVRYQHMNRTIWKYRLNSFDSLRLTIICPIPRFFIWSRLSCAENCFYRWTQANMSWKSIT